MQSETDSRGPNPEPPLSVGVAVDLERGAGAGGHVKCWERFAEAAARDSSPVDLTVYFLGAEERVEPLSDRVRFHMLAAERGTRALGLDQGAGHTDLAPVHPGLSALLGRHHVLHATSAFAFSRTMKLSAARSGVPLVASVHTDLPSFAAHYTGEVIGNRLNGNLAGRAVARVLVDGLHAPRLAAAWMERKVLSILHPAAALLYSHEGQRNWMEHHLPDKALRRLRRGVDKDLFRPDRAARGWLAQRFGVPEGGHVLMFAGRLDASKNVMLAARAVRRLIEAGRPVHFLAAGEGAEREAIAALLGRSATLAGRVEQADLARMYAAADLLIFPSTSETFGNVVQEARACGLPSMVPAGTAQAQMIARPGQDGLVCAGLGVQEWAGALEAVLDDSGRLAAMREAVSRAARALPDWGDVLREDLLPVWRGAQRRKKAPRRQSGSYTDAA